MMDMQKVADQSQDIATHLQGAHQVVTLLGSTHARTNMMD